MECIPYTRDDVSSEYTWINSAGAWCRLVKNHPDIWEYVGRYSVEALAWGYLPVHWVDLDPTEQKDLIAKFRANRIRQERL